MHSGSASVPPDRPRAMVSIGMPVFNGMPFLRRSLDCLLAQSYGDFELIISDNASTDDTPTICREYAARDARIRYFRQDDNIGASANFCFVLDQARGEFFLWAAADDELAPNWIEHLVSNVKPTDLGIFASYQYIDASGAVIGPVETPPCLRRNSQLSTFLRRETSGKAFFIYALFRRRSLAEARPFAGPTFLGADQIIVGEMLSRGDLRAVPGAILRYRVHESNLSAADTRRLGVYRRRFLSVYPAAYYAQFVRTVPPSWRLVAFLLVPVKYIVEQVRSYAAMARLLVTKPGRVLSLLGAHGARSR